MGSEQGPHSPCPWSSSNRPGHNPEADWVKIGCFWTKKPQSQEERWHLVPSALCGGTWMWAAEISPHIAPLTVLLTELSWHQACGQSRRNGPRNASGHPGWMAPLASRCGSPGQGRSETHMRKSTPGRMSYTGCHA